MKKLLLVFTTLILVLSLASTFALANEATEQKNYSVNDINAKLCEVLEVEGLSVTTITIVPGEQSKMVIYGIFTSGKNEGVIWSGEYDLTADQYLALSKVNDSALVYEAGKTELTNYAVVTVITAIEATHANLDIGDLTPNFANFTREIKYMGLGMLGIFVVVGALIIITYILNKITSKKQA